MTERQKHLSGKIEIETGKLCLLNVDLSDGRSISASIAWFPGLLHSSEEERYNWRLIGRGQGIHWDGIDEDISIEGLLAGRPSGESQESFEKWLAARS